MNDETRTFVRQRAGQRCEYCRVPQYCYPDFIFHIEHICAKQHGGTDQPDNLALACHLCNYHKGSNLAGLDPDTGGLTRLFNPRIDVWEGHFRWAESGHVVGLTALGRTTVYVLRMNEEIRVALRREILRQEA